MTEKQILFNTEMVRAILSGRKTQTRRIVKNQSLTEECLKKCGKPCYPGDTLWVRETWTVWSRTFGTMPAFHYKADGEDLKNVKWHPSIHMPKEAARIFLRVTDICCERLQDITEQDARAEGLVTDQPEDGRTNINFMCSVDCLQGSARGKFALLWNSTIKKTDLPRYGWDANPWVWVISFEKI